MDDAVFDIPLKDFVTLVLSLMMITTAMGWSGHVLVCILRCIRGGWKYERKKKRAGTCIRVCNGSAK